MLGTVVVPALLARPAYRAVTADGDTLTIYLATGRHCTLAFSPPPDIRTARGPGASVPMEDSCMSVEPAALDRDKSPLPAVSHDVVGIAEALRLSPHIRNVDDVSPGDAAVWFRDASGVGYTLYLTAAEPIMTDAPPGEAYVGDAVAAAIGSHPDFLHATYKDVGADRLETITALTRTGNEYTLTMTLTPRPCSDDTAGPPAPVAHVLRAADQLRSHNETDPDSMAFDAAADLLEHIADAWERQDDQTRQPALAFALALVL
ncbi:hypothetical protein ACFUCH_12195 [Streptomyces olivaceus]|uniref:hypothetical protein n=1 Tax=Streptomyces olivaceus TaxID=47716 RepID=UPI00362F44D7